MLSVWGLGVALLGLLGVGLGVFGYFLLFSCLERVLGCGTWG